MEKEMNSMSDSGDILYKEEYKKKSDYYLYKDLEDERCGTEVFEDDENRPKTNFEDDTVWSKVGTIYRPSSNTVERLEAGYYTFNADENRGFFFNKEEINLNKLFYLPNKASDVMMKDISDFWTLKDAYKKYSRVFKRNYLLYSAPGTGKTSIINLMCRQLIDKYDGVVFMVNDQYSLRLSETGLKLMHKIEPDRKMIMIIEDIDNYVGRNRNADSYLLNLLDGNIKIPNLVIIATTNYIDQMEARFTNRPSRFSRVLEYPLPNEESRKIFITNTVMEDDLEKINLDEWVKKTEGYTVDHINELIVQFFIHGYSEEEAFASVSQMVKKNDNLKNKDSVDLRKTTIGFGLCLDDDYPEMDGR